MKIKREAAALTRIQPQKAQTKEPTDTLDQSKAAVNARNDLRDLRLRKEIPVAAMVKIVRRQYPRYDKHLQSKCERSSVYGVRLCDDAMDTLIKTYDPQEAKPKRKPENRKLPCRISCRMTVEDYNRLMDQVAAEGFQTTQDWLLSHIKRYLERAKL